MSQQPVNDTSNSSELSYLERYCQKIGPRAAKDFRSVALAKKVLHLLGENPGTILDIGCGFGVFVCYAALQGHSVRGIDTSKFQIQGAKRMLCSQGLPDHIIQYSTIQEVTEKGSTFDACVVLDVLEHIQHPSAFLRSIRTILTLQGRLVVSVPAIPEFYDERDRLFGHYLRYDPETLRHHLEDGGFRIEHIQYWNVLGYLKRTIQHKKPSQTAELYEFRFSNSLTARLLNSLLKAYFVVIENRIQPGIGLSLLAVAKPQ